MALTDWAIQWDGSDMRILMSPLVVLLTGVGAACATDAAAPPAASSRVVLERQLPGGVGLPHVRAVEVTYPPGASSAAHTHPCPVVVFVIDGAVRTKVGAAPEAVHRAGETFVEAAGDAHLVSANASDAAPARFLATFTCTAPHDAYSTPLPSTPGASAQ
jgi:quercetin dioxygenase-like cupin family protein